MKTTKQPNNQIRLYVSILAVLLISIVMTNCQTEEDLIKEQDTATALIYKEQITAFLGTLNLGGDKSQNKKIDELLQVLDNASISTIDLKSTEKLIIVKTNSLKDFETNDAVRLIFVQYQNKIFRSNIVTFNNSSDFNDYDALLQAIFDRKATKYHYSGTIKFHNPYQAGILELNYQQGELVWQGAVRNKNKQKANQKSNGCTDWYWVTTYSDGHVKQEYLYTTCSCEEEAYRTANYCGGGGSGGSSSGNNASTSTQPIQYPENPVDNQLFVYIDNDGQMIERKYNSATATWVITSITLSEVVINNNRENYNTEFYMIPDFNAKVKQNFFGIDFIFTYDPASASWEGQSEEAIADAIEDKIDDSELDPCTKEVLDKLKTLSQNDIASIFEKFGIPENGTYNIKMVSGPLNSSVATAHTKWISKNNYLITVSDSYTKGTANYQKPPTDLAVAAVIVHELIHAHFFALFDDFHNNGNVCAYDSFDCLYEKFVSKNYTGPIDEQHAQMFDNYVPKMAAILQEFKPGLSSQFYEDLAMSTMVDLQYFNDRFPKGSLDRVRIENTRYSEDLNIPKGDATPKGSPCN